MNNFFFVVDNSIGHKLHGEFSLVRFQSRKKGIIEELYTEHPDVSQPFKSSNKIELSDLLTGDESVIRTI